MAAPASSGKKRGWDPVAAAGIPGEPLDVTPSKPEADPVNPSIHDPTPPPPPPNPESSATVERLQRAIEAAKREPALVPPPPTPPPPVGPAFRVRETRVVNLRGSLTTLARGSIVRAVSHDLASIREQGVPLDPV